MIGSFGFLAERGNWTSQYSYLILFLVKMYFLLFTPQVISEHSIHCEFLIHVCISEQFIQKVLLLHAAL